MPEYIPKRRRVGGLRLEAHKARSTRSPIRGPFVPARLWIPIEAAGGRLPDVCVRSEARVLKGQIIARGTDTSPHVHASTSGRIMGIEPRSVVTGGELRETACVVLDADGLDEHVPAPERLAPPPNPLERIARAGIVGLGGAAFSTALKVAQTQPCRILVINGAECEPYISCDDMLMRQHAPEIVAGSLELCELAAAETCIIAIERDKPQAIAAIRAAVESAADERLMVAEIPSIYPAGGERQLIDLLVALEVPSGEYPSDVGMLCQNVGTAYAVHRALAHEEPLLARVVTVTGDGIADPQNVEALIGTSIGDLVEYCGGYTDAASHLIVGGSMMGVSIPTDATPISKSTNCVIAASHGEVAATSDEWPCIRCGECALVCPAYLLPQSLLVAARGLARSRLSELGLADCIECGCCDAVCPSHIHLTETFRGAKLELAAWRERNALAAESQRRYAARAERLAHARDAEHDEQSRLIEELGTEASTRRRSIEAAVERARKRRDGPGET